MTISTSVDPDLCIGSTECNRIAPDAFRIDDDRGVSVPLPGAAATAEVLIVSAAEACPTQAIRLQRADGTLIHGEP